MLVSTVLRQHRKINQFMRHYRIILKRKTSALMIHSTNLSNNYVFAEVAVVVAVLAAAVVFGVVAVLMIVQQ